MKAEAKESRMRPNQLLSQTLLQTTDDVQANIGNLNTVKRDLQRQHGCLPKDPASLQQLIIPDEWKLTGEAIPRTFLFHDTGSEERQRVVVYAAEEQLRLLCQSDTWYMDGNFAMSPSIFEQLYVIRTQFGEYAVSCVYAFLPGKSQQNYQEMLQLVVDKLEALQIFPDPRTFITDFELAAIQSVSMVLGPQVTTQGYFYHLCQSTWRKIQELGLTALYHADDEVKHFCGMRDGLAFLPQDRVQHGMQYLKDHTPEWLEPLVEYFDSTYVNGTYRRVQGQVQPDGQLPPLRVRRTPPQFPIHCWNIHEATLEGPVPVKDGTFLSPSLLDITILHSGQLYMTYAGTTLLSAHR